MTSLEWIYFEINFCKQKINKLKGEILYQKSMAILLPENNINLTLVNEFEISLNEEKIKHLEQIKNILEAWEFTKRELGLKVIERNCGMFGSGYALKCDYEDVIPLLDKEVESFEKALEVENE